MVTFNSSYYGLSTDEKPTVGVCNGSAIIEMDTGKKYLYSAGDSTWYEQPASGGGGGGSGGGVLVVNVDTETGALDKTWQEIHDAPIAVVHSTNEACPSEVIVGCFTGYELDAELGDYVPKYYVMTYAGEWVQDGSSGYVEEVRRNYYTRSTDGFPVLINYGG